MVTLYGGLHCCPVQGIGFAMISRVAAMAVACCVLPSNTRHVRAVWLHSVLGRFQRLGYECQMLLVVGNWTCAIKLGSFGMA